MAAHSWNGADADGERRTLNILRLIVAFTYIYSGLQKINLNFMENDFPWLVQPITNLFPATAPFLHGVGMAAPFVQVAFGIGLLTRRFRRVSLMAAVAMHLFILTMFGPMGLDWNNIVWPWTAAMAMFDVLLFSGGGIFMARDRMERARSPSSRGHRAVRDAAGAEFLQSLGFLSVLGALFRQSDGGADLSLRRRQGRLARGDRRARGAYLAGHQCPEPATLGDRRPQRDALSRNPRLQGDREAAFAASCAIRTSWC